ncbi:MAG: class B sortase [Oscillospiraceae bacterium]|nr:class B sortase [Oscillospiraceae bacterium]MBQ2231234.1 class B sortase [Oscillospiraceae bacterium]MBQ3985931.1 class B sortase [Oscillospiraceae bacterium]
MNRKLRIILIILLAAVFCFSAYMIISDLAESHREKETYTSLADLVHSREQEIIESSQSGGNGESTPGSKDVPKKYIGEDGSITQEVVVPAAPVYAESGILYQYDAVYELNNDLAGWLYIEGAGIDYPVMYTPRNEQYYLRKNFEKTYATGGCLFIGKTWSEDSNQTIIYGHNMHDGSMFGHLHEYKSKEYALEHSIIHFDTLHETREYEVVAAFYGKVYKVDETGVFRYYRYTDLSTEAKFNEFMKNVRRAAIYDTGVDVQFGDRLLTLSTCSYYTNEGRFVVVARQRVPQAEE